MQANYKTIKDAIKSRFHDSSLSSTVLSILVNSGRDKMLRNIKPFWTIQKTNFTAVVSQSTYLIKDLQGEDILTVINYTDDQQLFPISQQELDETDPDRADGGDTRYFTTGRLSYVTANPTGVGTVLAVTCASASDTTQKLRIKGTVGGATTEEELTLNGGTQNSANIYTALEFIGLDSTTVGKVTCTSNTAAVTNVIIPSGYLHQPHQELILYNAPDATDVYQITSFVCPRPLVQDQDPLYVPDQWIPLLLDMAAIEAHRWGYEIQNATDLIQTTGMELQSFKERYAAGRRGKYSLANPTLPHTLRSERPATIV